MTLFGAGVQAKGQLKEGKVANQAAKFEAAQMEIKGDEAYALATRAAAQERHKGVLLASRANALAAASGGGTDNQNITHIIAGIENEAEYNSMMEMYKGNVQRQDLFLGAKSRRVSGKNAKTAAYYNAAGTILGGVAKAGEQAVSMGYMKGGGK
jgi:hypothetical protein